MQSLKYISDISVWWLSDTGVSDISFSQRLKLRLLTLLKRGHLKSIPNTNNELNHNFQFHLIIMSHPLWYFCKFTSTVMNSNTLYSKVTVTTRNWHTVNPITHEFLDCEFRLQTDDRTLHIFYFIKHVWPSIMDKANSKSKMQIPLSKKNSAIVKIFWSQQNVASIPALNCPIPN